MVSFLVRQRKKEENQTLSHGLIKTEHNIFKWWERCLFTCPVMDKTPRVIRRNNLIMYQTFTLLTPTRSSPLAVVLNSLLYVLEESLTVHSSSLSKLCVRVSLIVQYHMILENNI